MMGSSGRRDGFELGEVLPVSSAQRFTCLVTRKVCLIFGSVIRNYDTLLHYSSRCETGSMFCDWLSMWQQHDDTLPDFNGGRVVSIEGGCGLARRETIDADGVLDEAWALCGEDASIEFDTPKFVQHSGSYETNLLIRMRGGRVEVRGNPSKFGRLDNVFGMGIDDCVAAINDQLELLGLPPFTEGQVERFYDQRKDAWSTTYTGAHIIRADITQNVAVGSGNVQNFHQWLGQQRLYNKAPGAIELNQFASWNWGTVALSSSFMMHVKAYDKGSELEQVSLPHYLKKLKAAAKAGRISKSDIAALMVDAEQYLGSLALWCAEVGLSRLEWSFKSRWFAQHEGFGFWKPGETEGALFDEAEKHMGKITDRAIVYQADAELGLTRSEKGALAMWREGRSPDEIAPKSTFYRLRKSILTKCGKDIAVPCQNKVETARPVFFKIGRLHLCDAPSWYVRPSFQMRLAA